MIFKLLNVNGSTSLGANIGGKSFGSIFGQLFHGHGLGFSLFGGEGQISKKDIEMLTDYSLALQSGVDSTEAFQETMANASAGAIKLADGVRDGTVNVNNLSSSFSLLNSSSMIARVGVSALNMALTAGIMYGISKAIQGLSNLIHIYDRLHDSVNNSVGDYRKQHNEIIDNASSLSNVSDRFEELSSGVDANGRNISLSTSEYQEYLDICNQIAEMCPSLVSGYDSQNNAIINLTGGVQDLTSALNDLKIAADSEILSKGVDILRDYNDTLAINRGGKASSQWVVLGEMFKRWPSEIWYQLTGQGTGGITELGYGRGVEYLDSIMHSTDIRSTAERYLTNDVVADYITDALQVMGIKRNDGESQTDWVLRAVSDERSIVRAFVSEHNKTIDDAVSNMRTLTEAYMEESILGGDYQNIGNQLRDTILNDVVPTFDREFFDQFGGDQFAFYSYLNSLLSQFDQLSPDDSERFTLAFDMQTKLNNGECTVGEYLDATEGIDKIIGSFDEQDQKYLNLAFNVDYANSLRIKRAGLQQKFGGSDRMRGQDFDTVKSEVNEFMDWINSMSADDLELLWTIMLDTDNANLSLDELKDKFISTKTTIESAVKVSYEDFAKSDKKKDILDPILKRYQDAQSALDSLQKGETTADELIVAHPEWASFADDMENGLIQAAYDAKTEAETALNTIGEGINAEDLPFFERFREAYLAQFSDNTTSFGINIDAESKGMDNVISSIKSSVSELGLNNEQMAELTKRYKDLEGFNPDELFERTTNGIHLNTEALMQNESAYEDLMRSKIDSDLQKKVDDYAQLTEEINNATDATRRNELIAQRSVIGKDIENLRIMQSQYAALTSAYNKWKKAQSMGEEGDMYDDITGSLKDIKKLYDDGLIGTNKFRAAVQLMTDEDLTGKSAYELAAIYDEAYPKMERYFKDGQTGVKNFLTDIEKLGKGWATVDENGNWQLDFNAEDVAKELGVSVEMVEIMARKLKDFGFDIDLSGFGSGLDAYTTDLESGLEAIDAERQKLETKYANGEISLGEFVAETDQLDHAEEVLTSLQDSDTVDVDVEADNLEEANRRIQEMSTTIAVLTEKGIEIPVVLTGEYDKLCELLGLSEEDRLLPVDVPIETSGDGQENVEQTTEDVENLNNSSANPTLTANDQASESVQAVSDDVEDLDGETADPDITANNEQASSSVEEIYSALTGLNEEGADPSITADNADASEKIDETESSLETLDGDGANPTVGIAGNAPEALTGIQEQIEGLPESKTITVTTKYEEVPVTGEEPGYVDNTHVNEDGQTVGYSGVLPYQTRPEYKGKDRDIVPPSVEAAANEWEETATAIDDIAESGRDVFDNMIGSVNDMTDFALTSKDAAATVMQDFFGKDGYVDLLKRNVISSDWLADLGYDAERGGIATLFSHSYTMGENGEIGVVLTPILPNGDVLEPDTFQDAVSSLMVGSDGKIELPDGDWGFDLSDILISQIDLSDVPEELRGQYLNAFAEALHNVQDYFYDGQEPIETPIQVEPEPEIDESSYADKIQGELDNTEVSTTANVEVTGEPITSLDYGDISSAGNAVIPLLDAAQKADVAESSIKRLSDAYGQLMIAMDGVRTADPSDTGAMDAAIGNLKSAASEFTSAFSDLGSQVDIDAIPIDADTSKALETIAAISAPETEVVFNPNTKAVDAYAPSDKNARVNFTANFSRVVSATVPTLRGVIEYQRKIVGSVGTTVGSAKASGTAYKGGIGKLDEDTDALSGELGRELVVRDGKFFTVGDNGAEFFKFKSGDIIFNASQTEELFRTGKIRSGGGRGKVFGDGSAYATGTAFVNVQGTDGGGVTVSGGGKLTNGSQSSGKKKKKKKKQDSTDSSSDDVFDWIEVAISRVERAITNLSKVATSTFKSLATRLSATNLQIQKINEELSVQQQGYDRYMQQANSVDLSDDLKQRVQSGAIDIASYDEDTQKKIKDYQEWYEKALACSDAIDDLHNSLSQLYQDKYDSIQKDFENQLSLIEHDITTLDNISSMSDYNATIKPFDAMINAQNRSLEIQKSELAGLQQAMAEAISSGEIREGSEAWYEMQSSINSVKESIQETELEIAKLYRDSFDAVEDDFTNRMSAIERALNTLDNIVDASEYTGDAKPFDDMIALERQSVRVLNDELVGLEEQLAKAMDAGIIKEGSKEWYEMTGVISQVKDKIQETQVEVAKLFKQGFDEVVKVYSNSISTLDNSLSKLNKDVEASDYTASAKPFADMISISVDRIQLLNGQLEDLNTSLEYALKAEDGIKEGSDAWYEMKDAINAVEQELQQAQIDLAKIFATSFSSIKSNFENALSLAENAITYIKNVSSASEYTGAAKPFSGMMDAQRTKVKTLEDELASLKQSLNTALESGTIKEYSDEWYEMQNAINKVNNEIQETQIEISKLYKDGFDDIDKQFGNVLKLAEQSLKFYKSIASASEYTGEATPFGNMLDTETKNIEILENELSRLKQSLSDAMNAEDGIEKYSDAWYEMKSKIADVEDKIRETGIEISKLYKDSFDSIESRFGNVMQLTDQAMTYFNNMVSMSTYMGNDKPFTNMIETERKSISTLETELDRLEQALADALDSGAIQKHSNAWYAMQASISSVKSKIQQNMIEISKIYKDSFNAISKEFSNLLSFTSASLDLYNNLVSASEYTGAEKPFAEMIDVQRKNIRIMQNQLVALEDSLSEAVSSGAIIEGSDAWIEMRGEINKTKSAIQSAAIEIAKMYTDVFNAVESRYSTSLTYFSNITKAINNGLSEIEERGYLGGVQLYSKLTDVERMNIAIQKKELVDLESALANAIDSGEIKKGSSAWYEMQNAINEVKNSIEESEIAIVKYGNAIRQINWDTFDYVQARISDITDEAEFLTNLMSNDKSYDDKGQITDTGKSQIGLRTLNYDVYMAQADKYADEVEKLNEEIANNSYDTKLIDRRNEMLKLQRESIIAAEQEKDAIADLVEEGINAELDALRELIEAYEENLDSARDLYEYQKNIEKQTKNIASLQKQLSAYSGDTSEENRARLQKLKVDLSDSLEELEATQYEQYIADQKKLLDDLYDEYESILNQRLDNVDYLLEEMINATNANSLSILDTLNDQSNSVGSSLSDIMSSIWTTNNNSDKIVSTYGDGMMSNLTNANDSLVRVIDGVGTLFNETNVISDKVSKNATDMLNAVINADQSIGDLHSELQSQMKDTGDQLYNGIATSAEQAAASINEKTGDASTLLNGTISTDDAALNATIASGDAALNATISADDAALNASLGENKGAIDLVKGAVDSFNGSIDGRIVDVSNKANGCIDAVRLATIEEQNALAGKGDAITDKIGSSSQSTVDQINKQLGEDAEAYKTAIGEANANASQATVSGINERLGEGTVTGTITSEIDDMETTISDALDDVNDKLDNGNIAEEKNIEALIATAQNAGDNSYNTAKTINENVGKVISQLNGIADSVHAIAEAPALGESTATVDTPSAQTPAETPEQSSIPIGVAESVTSETTTPEVSDTSSSSSSSSKKKKKKKSSSSSSSNNTNTNTSNIGTTIVNAIKTVATVATVGSAVVGAVKKAAKKVKGKAKGGFFAEAQKIAYQNGDDIVTVNTLKEGEAVLTQSEAAQFKVLTNNLPKLQGLVDVSDQLRSVQTINTSNGNVDVGGIDLTIQIDHVQDYNDLLKQMRDDKNFEKMIDAMTLQKALGKNSLSKKKYYN